MTRLLRGAWLALTVLVLLLPAATAGAPVAIDRPSTAPSAASAAPLAAPFGGSPAVVAPTPRWVNLTGGENGSSPPAASDASLAYDPADGEWVYFGGCSYVACPSNATWVYANGGWSNRTSFGPAPPGREDAAMDFDANAGGVLLFGGFTANGSALNDTWLFRDGQWANMDYLGPAPPARFAASLVFDPEETTNGSLLFGGCIPTFGAYCLNDTWRWQPGAGWTDIGASSGVPAVRGFAMMAYDAIDHEVVLFGGVGNCLSTICYYNDTWEYYSNTWWPVHPGGATPTARYSGVLTSDPNTGGLLLFGGFDGPDDVGLNDTWTLAGGAWTELTGVGGPSPRYSAALSVDSAGAVPLLFGGVVTPSDDFAGDTWVFEPSLSLQVSGPPAVGAEVNATVTVTVSVTGGTPPYAVSVDFGDGTGATANGTQTTFTFPHAYATAGPVTLLASVTDLPGASINRTAAGSITAGPSVRIAPANAAGDVGFPVAFSALAGAGSPALTAFSWSFGGGGNATGANASHAFATAGAFPVTVQATDASGAMATANLSFPVNPLPTASLMLSAASVEVGAPLALLGGVSGGSAPFHFAWLLGDGGSAAGADPSYTFSQTGHYTVQLWVNDSVGASAHASASVAVTGPPAGTPPPATAASGIPSWYWGALAGIALATVVGAALLLWRRGRRPVSVG